MERLRTLILDQGPTKEQESAIFAEDHEFLLRASPGSGKTWTSCRRFIWRGASWDHPVGGLALLSFTNAAIREFHAATTKVGQRQLLSDPNFVGTFDSFVERFVISPFGHLATGGKNRPKLFLAARPGDWKNQKIKGWTTGSGGRKMPVPAWEIIPGPENGTIAYRASRSFGGKKLDFRNGNPVFNFFKLGFYTHSQRVFLACKLLRDRPHIAKCVSRRFPEIVVDEAQDTNIWLLILLNILREEGSKVTLIGDPDQCIYEFSMADADSLPLLRKEWGIPELPLSRSFRCNDAIANAVKHVGGNTAFSGNGEGINSFARPYIVREPSTGFSICISAFEQLLRDADIANENGAILCRAHQQLESIRGDAIYVNLKGITKQLALAAFFRDLKKDYLQSRKIVESALREMTGDEDLWEEIDDDPNSDFSLVVRGAIWQFTKSTSGLPPLSEIADDWLGKLKVSLSDVLKEIGISNVPSMGQKIRKTGLESGQLGLPMFTEQTVFPKIRQSTIHQVKGETISGVLVLGSAKFFNAVVTAAKSGTNTEERRLAYVAMTRAQHSLLVGLPATHFDRYKSTWQDWGFDVLK